MGRRRGIGALAAGASASEPTLDRGSTADRRHRSRRRRGLRCFHASVSIRCARPPTEPASWCAPRSSAALTACGSRSAAARRWTERSASRSPSAGVSSTWPASRSVSAAASSSGSPPSSRPRHACRARVLALRDVENPLLGSAVRPACSGLRRERHHRWWNDWSAVSTPRGGRRADLGIDLRGSRRWRLGGRRRRRRGRVSGCDARARRATRPATVALRRSVARADVVITGEGRLDAQSLDGKLVSAVAAAAARRQVPVAASRDAWRSTKPWPQPTGSARWRRRVNSEVPDAEAGEGRAVLEAAGRDR